MATNEEIFFKEFNQMINQLKATNGVLDLYNLPLPNYNFRVEKSEIVAIGGIEVEYYEKLNNSECLLWSWGQLKRRKFDYKGEYIKDKDGNQIFVDVTLPHECVAVVSDIVIGVPLKFKSEEHFEYVDMITRRENNKIYYVYIIPRKYCYKINQVALVANTNKMRSYYDGIGITLKNGNILYLYTIPYKPSKQIRGYRIIHTKTNNDFSKELTLIKDYWLKNNYMFNPEKCAIMEGIKGRDNLAIQSLPVVMDEYIRFDPSKNMDTSEEIFDLE